MSLIEEEQPRYIKERQNYSYTKSKLCNKCQIPLTEETWNVSSRIMHSYICKICLRERGRIWFRIHAKLMNERRRKERLKLKYEIFAYYSKIDPPRCANPFGIHETPFTILDALSLDHIHGDGRILRTRGQQMGWKYYKWLKDNNYPLEHSLQILCMNCQFIKRNRNREWGKS